MDIIETIEAIERINVNAAVLESVDETADEIKALLLTQLEAGTQNDGEAIHWQNPKRERKDNTFPYTKKYAKRKANLGFQTSVVDLNLGGEYWESIEAEAFGDAINFESKDEKAVYLEENYNADKIYGLNEANKAKYIDDSLRDKVISKVSEQSGIKID
jgi:hypothetical protein